MDNSLVLIDIDDLQHQLERTYLDDKNHDVQRFSIDLNQQDVELKVIHSHSIIKLYQKKKNKIENKEE